MLKSYFKLLFIIVFVTACSTDSETVTGGTLIGEVCTVNSHKVTRVTSTTATVKVTGSSSAIEFEYGAKGYAQGTGTKILPSNGSFNLLGLSPLTYYDYYVNVKCNTTESSWQGPFRIYTVCGSDNGIFSGDKILKTQAEVDAFAAECYSGINGVLQIGQGGSFNDIESLLPLSKLTFVTDIRIVGTKLKNLNGLYFSSLVSLRDFNVGYNRELEEITDVELPSVIDNVNIYNNDKLTSLKGLEELTRVAKTLIIDNNNGLLNIQGLNNISVVESLSIERNTSLKKLQGFDSLSSVDEFLIVKTSLESLEGLEALTTQGPTDRFVITGNKELTTLKGLSALSTVNELLIKDGVLPGVPANDKLEDYCALTKLVTTGSYSTISISGNALYNPSVQDIVKGNCKK